MLTDNQITSINALQKKALLVGVLALAVTAAGAVLQFSITALFQPLLIAYLAVLGLAVGPLAVLMVHHLCGGSWSFVIQRICEAASRTIWIMAVIGIFVLLGAVFLTEIYPWTSKAALESRNIVEVVEKKTAFLNLGSFIVCGMVYFGIWCLLAGFFNGRSVDLDRTGRASNINAMKFLAAPGLIVYVLTMTFAATHWVMSLEPEWFSTIFGAWMISGYALTALSFCVIVLSYLAKEEPLKSLAGPKQYHHLGTFLGGFTIFWSYVSFSQFLLIWNANLPEEIGWYLNRQGGGLTFLTIVMIIANWLIPFFYLLIRSNKTNVQKIRRIAYYVLAVRLIDLYWNIAPSFDGHHGKIVLSTVIFTVTAAAGLGGVWLYFFLAELKKRPLVPQNDPRQDLLFLRYKAHSHA